MCPYASLRDLLRVSLSFEVCSYALLHVSLSFKHVSLCIITCVRMHYSMRAFTHVSLCIITCVLIFETCVLIRYNMCPYVLFHVPLRIAVFDT